MNICGREQDIFCIFTVTRHHIKYIFLSLGNEVHLAQRTSNTYKHVKYISQHYSKVVKIGALCLREDHLGQGDPFPPIPGVRDLIITRATNVKELLNSGAVVIPYF